MSAETEAIIKISSYVQDIGVIEIVQSVCIVCITICAIIVVLNSLFK